MHIDANVLSDFTKTKVYNMIPNQFELTDSRSGLSRKANYKTQGTFLTTESYEPIPDAPITDLNTINFDKDFKEYMYLKTEFCPHDKVN
jgi:hypothetical protein